MAARKGSTSTKKPAAKSPAAKKRVAAKKQAAGGSSLLGVLKTPVGAIALVGLLALIGIAGARTVLSMIPRPPKPPEVLAESGLIRPYEAEMPPTWEPPPVKPPQTLAALPVPPPPPTVLPSAAPLSATPVAAVVPAASEPVAPTAPAPKTLALQAADSPPAAVPAPAVTASSAAAPAAGLPAWQRYAVAPPVIGGHPMVTIVFDDMGVDLKRSAKAILLPGPLTISYMSYAEDLPAQTKAARAHGHELIEHVPMQPQSDSVDPGPGVLKVSMSPAEVAAQLTADLSHIDGIVGINNHMGSRFTEDTAGMKAVMGVLKQRGLIWFDSRTSAKTVGYDLAEQAGVPTIQRNVFLDDTDNVKAVTAQLAEVERVARKTGSVIAIGHPRDATIEALSRWLPTLRAKGLVLVPLSTQVRVLEAKRAKQIAAQ